MSSTLVVADPQSHSDPSAHPQKRKKLQKYHRIKAHSNPLTGTTLCPANANEADRDWWPARFPLVRKRLDSGVAETEGEGGGTSIEFLDVGCGYGGLIVALSSLFPSKIILGMEIRPKVVEYVEHRIAKLRASSDLYNNIAVIQANTMRFLPNYVRKGQLQKIFFTFPDPHFKRSNQRRRIINTCLVPEYAWALGAGGRLYTITDVEDLHLWMVEKLNESPLFQRLSDEDLTNDVTIDAVTNATEEANKVRKAGGKSYLAVYVRLALEARIQ